LALSVNFVTSPLFVLISRQVAASDGEVLAQPEAIAQFTRRQVFFD
jgi:hypothetical protein